jgi:hypothetical protein
VERGHAWKLDFQPDSTDMLLAVAFLINDGQDARRPRQAKMPVFHCVFMLRLRVSIRRDVVASIVSHS